MATLKTMVGTLCAIVMILATPVMACNTFAVVDNPRSTNNTRPIHDVGTGRVIGRVPGGTECSSTVVLVEWGARVRNWVEYEGVRGVAACERSTSMTAPMSLSGSIN